MFSWRDRWRVGTPLLAAVLAGGAAFAWWPSATTSVTTSEAGQAADEPIQAIARSVDSNDRPTPVMTEADAVAASLAALSGNGVLTQLQEQGVANGMRAADGAGMIPIVHVVDCEESACGQVVAWAAANNVTASDPILSFGHGGVEQYHLELREYAPANASLLTARANSVMDAVDALDGVAYQSWMADTTTTIGNGKELIAQVEG
jgi:hypothetical protein